MAFEILSLSEVLGNGKYFELTILLHLHTEKGYLKARMGDEINVKCFPF